MTYRGFLYRAQVLVFTTIGFIALAQYSLYAISPDFERDQMDRIYRQIERELTGRMTDKQRAIMDVYNITPAQVARPVDLFGERGPL